MQNHRLIELSKYYDSKLLDAFKEGGLKFANVSHEYINKEINAKNRILMLRALYDISHRPDLKHFETKYKELLSALPDNKELLLLICKELCKQGYCTERDISRFKGMLMPAVAKAPDLAIKTVKKTMNTHSTVTNFFETLPNEILSKIAENLSKQDLGRLRQVSKFFAENTEIINVQLNKQHPSLFACGESRTYLICDNGANVITFPYDDENEVKEIKFPDHTDMRQIAVGSISSYGVSQNGQLFKWRNQNLATPGKNEGLPTLFPLPRFIEPAQVVVGQVTAEHFLLIRASNGNIYAFGNNNHGQLGVKGISDKTNLYKIELGRNERARDIAAGAFHGLCCTREGKVYSWGNNDPSVKIINFPKESHIMRVAASYSHSLALSQAGDVFAWSDQSEPRQVMLPADHKIIHIEVGRDYACCMSLDGRVYAWKNGDLEAALVTLPDNIKAVNIASNGQHTLIAASDGKVYDLEQGHGINALPVLRFENERIKVLMPTN